MTDLVLPCPGCRTLNRVPHDRLGDVPVCSECRAHLLGAPVPLDEHSFAKVLARTSLPIVVDFWAPWCGPCRTFAPTFAAVAQELAGEFVFAKVDTEAMPQLAAAHGIQSIPTLLLFAAGHEVKRVRGALPRAQLVHWLQQR